MTRAMDLASVKQAALDTMDSLLVDIINADYRREKGDQELSVAVDGVRRQVEALEYRLAQLEQQLRQLNP